MQYTLRSFLGTIALGTLVSLLPSALNAGEAVETQIQEQELPPILREGEAEFVRRPGDAEALLYEPAQPLAESEPAQDAESAEAPLEGGISTSDAGPEGDLLARADESLAGSDEPEAQPRP